MSVLDNLKAEPLPQVVVEPWTLVSGWPGFHVYLLAPLFDQHGDHFAEIEQHADALAAARILSACTGWPITDLARETG